MTDQRRPRYFRPPRRYQFSLASLLLVTALVAVLAAALGGMLREEFGGGSAVPLSFYVLMAVAAPVGMMIFVSLARLGYRLLVRMRRRR